jgi:tripartite-type tricarboxylate transporter receptor subunit TctC
MVGLFKKISVDKDWVAFAKKTGLQRDFITGDALMKFCENYEDLHIKIMKAQGWIK